MKGENSTKQKKKKKSNGKIYLCRMLFFQLISKDCTSASVKIYLFNLRSLSKSKIQNIYHRDANIPLTICLTL